MKKTYQLLSVIIISVLIACSSSSAPDEEYKPTEPEPSKVRVSTLANIEASDAIKLGDDGYIYASNYGIDRVYKVNKTGSFEIFASNQDGAAGIDFDDSGIMYLARYESGDVVKINTKGEVKEVYASGLPGPIAVEFDSFGNLYISNYLFSYISRVNKDGELKRFASHDLPSVSSLTLDNSGNIYITSYDQGRILKVDSKTGVVSNFISSRVNGFGYITYANNEFYATNINGNRVYRISMSGKIEILAGSGKSGYSDGAGNFAEFTRPLGISINSKGDTLYVADSRTIRMITNFLD